ncbi:MAG: ABC transporter ATP-binding protein [Caldisphaeraceae archaeon]|nr:ABC transporter ATP-binding protein [Caldisphaeraceae archaeon]
MPSSILTLENVTKKFGSFKALDNVNISVERGEIRGLVGPNGAGKSTLIKTSLGLLRRDHGKVLLFGKDPFFDPEARERVGVIYERPALPASMPVIEFLSKAAEIYGSTKEHLRDALELVGLEDQAYKPFSQLSAGQRQRAAIAHALVSSPEIIIADEPTSNLDPVERNKILELFLKINQERKLTILISSHVLHELLRISSTITIIKSGKIIKSGTPDEIVKNISMTRIRCKDPESLKELLSSLGFSFTSEGGNVYVKTEEKEVTSKLLNALSDYIKKGNDIYGIEFVEPGIEEILEE